jgi:hypothetical protein
MTVDTVEGDQVTRYWSTEFGATRSGSFRIAQLSAPITSPPADPDQQRDEGGDGSLLPKPLPVRIYLVRQQVRMRVLSC